MVSHSFAVAAHPSLRKAREATVLDRECRSCCRSPRPIPVWAAASRRTTLTSNYESHLGLHRSCNKHSTNAPQSHRTATRNWRKGRSPGANGKGHMYNASKVRRGYLFSSPGDPRRFSPTTTASPMVNAPAAGFEVPYRTLCTYSTLYVLYCTVLYCTVLYCTVLYVHCSFHRALTLMCPITY